MKITPIEIRQKDFERVFRGYEKETVDAFLAALSQEWEKLNDENRMLKMQLEISEKEVTRMKELEGTMFRTLKNAEDTRTRIAEEATHEAEKQVREASEEAQKLVQNAQNEVHDITSEAKKQANSLMVDAESKSRFIVDEAQNELKSLERDFKAMERYKEQMVKDLKDFTNDTLERINRFEEKLAKSGYDEKVNELQDLGQSLAQHTEPEPVEVSLPEPIVLKESKPLVIPSYLDDEDGELPTIASIMQSAVEEPRPENQKPMVTSETSAEIQSLLKEVKKNVKVKKAGDNDSKIDAGGSFFDTI